MENKHLFLLVDPSMVDMNDLIVTAKRGKLGIPGIPIIRLRSNAWGRMNPPIVLFRANETETFENIEQFSEAINIDLTERTDNGKN